MTDAPDEIDKLIRERRGDCPKPFHMTDFDYHDMAAAYEAGVAAGRAAGLEEAAKVAEAEAKSWRSYKTVNGFEDSHVNQKVITLDGIAAAIRARAADKGAKQ